MHLVRQAAGGGKFHGRLWRGVPRVTAGPGPRRLVHQVGGGGAGGGRTGETVPAIPLQWNNLTNRLVLDKSISATQIFVSKMSS